MKRILVLLLLVFGFDVAAQQGRYIILHPQRKSSASTTPEYWLNDTFTTDLAAGSVNGTAAEPGPGTRTVLDTGSKLALSGGTLYSTNNVANDPQIFWGNHPRNSGVVMLVDNLSYSAAGGVFYCSYDSDTSGGALDGVNVSGANLRVYNGGATIVAGTIGVGTYDFAVVSRSTGFFTLYRPGLNWILYYANNANTIAATNVVFGRGTGAAVVNIESIRVPKTTWLPVPTVSDGFSGSNGVDINGRSSDGLGHVEANGGSGVAATVTGTAYITNNAAYFLTANANISYSATTNILVGGNFTMDAGGASLVIARSNPANDSFVYANAERASGNVYLTKYVDSTPTVLATTAFTYSAGKTLALKIHGTDIRAFYNNSAVGASTVTDDEIDGNSGCGFQCGIGGNILDDVIVFPIGTEGQYSGLDAL